MRRFVAAGLQIFADEAVATGPPWNMTLCLRGHVYLKSPNGATVYENRYVIWGHMAWGLLRDYEVYEDTQRTNALTSTSAPDLVPSAGSHEVLSDGRSRIRTWDLFLIREAL